MALVDYTSSSSCDSAEENIKDAEEVPSVRLPLPSAISNMNRVVHPKPVDDPSRHSGRVRSFEHERGNWATHVYIPVNLSVIEDLCASIQSIFKDLIDLQPTDSVHISLTKTVVLRHHWIRPFVTSVEDSLHGFTHFVLDFQSFKIYTNESRTRTFIALAVNDVCFGQLSQIVSSIDGVMQDFHLDTFYKNPSFHASILWCVGDHASTISNRLVELNDLLREVSSNYLEDLRVRVEQIYCRSGNKNYNFALK